jgi:hypothetical protein
VLEGYEPERTRAVRYRQLALAESDKARADVLYRIADEADRDVFCTFDRTNFGSNRKPGPTPGNMS